MVEILNYRNSLPLDSVLLEYTLESVLGAGGFGITYLAHDDNLQKKVAIKEYLPTELAVRALDGSIVPINTGTEHNYKWGLDRFLQEARLLAKFSHPNIVQVQRYFEANGTAYMVMHYESGRSMSQILKSVRTLEESILLQIVLPLLDGLAAVHAAGFLHRDIKPSNIFIRDSGVPVLLDFGAARLAVESTTRTMTSILTPGYAPLEQYSKEGDQGEWTDVYSLAAVMFRAVTGDNPPDAVTRLKNDSVMQMLVAHREKYAPLFLHAINRGLEIDEKKRPQSVAAWRAMFTGEVPPAPPAMAALPGAGAGSGDGVEDAPTQRAEPAAVDERTRVVTPRPSMSQLTWFAAGTLAMFLMIGGVSFFKHPTEAAPAAPAAAFDALDTDHDGYLSPEEVKSDAALAADFPRLDTNHDGRLSRREFARRR